jgi:radical SAM/Cys-rich protein
MLATLPRLQHSDFPAIRRGALQTLQVNMGYLCNQQCNHCHVNAGPKRSEQMQQETVELVMQYLQVSGITQLDLTGGAPELNVHFRDLVGHARQLGIHVMDRCNLTILDEPGQQDLGEFLAGQGVEVIASLPCYLEENIDKQRGRGVYQRSLAGLRQLNALGYGQPDSGLLLNLVYNPPGASLPPAQQGLELDYRRELGKLGIRFNNLLTLANMPIQRFGSSLLSRGEFDDYMSLLKQAYRADNLNNVMCRSLLSVDWQGYLYDCDFNQMLGLPLQVSGRPRSHLRDLLGTDLEGNLIVVADHCYGCTAGQGSSCGGALS